MYLISNLAMVDGLVTLLFSPAIFPPTFSSLGDIYITYISNLAFTLNQVSIFFISLLVWQRYVSICQPHAAKKWTKISTLRIMALTAVALSLAVYFPGYFRYTLSKLPTGQYKALRTALGRNEIFYNIYTIGIITLVSYVLPMGIILFATTRLIQSLKSPTVTSSSQQAKRDLTLSVVIIVILFMILQSFRPIRYILISVYSPYTEAVACQGRLMHYGQITPAATILNSSVNFIIYVMYAKGFRKKVAEIVCRKKNEVATESGGSTDTNLDGK
jgi:hypothetical protein